MMRSISLGVFDIVYLLRVHERCLHCLPMCSDCVMWNLALCGILALALKAHEEGVSSRQYITGLAASLNRIRWCFSDAK